MRTRCWEDPEGCSNTVVQVRDDTGPCYVWIHSNMGWLQMSNKYLSYEHACLEAKEIGLGYGLEEASEERAKWMAGGCDEC